MFVLTCFFRLNMVVDVIPGQKSGH